MQARRILVATKGAGLTAFVLLALVWPVPGPAAAISGESISSPDRGGVSATDLSLALDSSGYPVVSYHDYTKGDLKVLHCNDADCAGRDESITAPDTDGDVGGYTSLALDTSGYPVVSYYDATNGDLKVLHCNDADCAGGDESITAPDTEGDVGEYTSLALDAAGHPVVSYHDATNGDLKVLHCNDPDCAGNDEGMAAPDTAGDAGRFTSLELDAAGYPVVSYYDDTNEDLRVLHCGDPNCTAGNSLTWPDTAGDVGWDTSLELDAAGYPVVSYHDNDNSDLKVLHCDDPNCAGDESGNTAAPDTAGGEYTSLALDASGNPVVSYYLYYYAEPQDHDLRLLHCNDPNCADGDDSIWPLDTAGDVGRYTSLALDAAGNAVVAYRDSTDRGLNVFHMGGIRTPDGGGDVGEYTSLALDASGNPVVSYYDVSHSALKVLHCNDPNCSGGDESVTSPDWVYDAGLWTSLVLDAAGNPVVSYHEDDRYPGSWNGYLKVLHCNDPNCAGGDDSITSPESYWEFGGYTSLALDAAGNPVVSYYDDWRSKLGVLHCNDPNCAGEDESITWPDASDRAGRYTSLALDAAGNPVVSYYDSPNDDLKVLHCNDPNCAGDDESITSPGTGLGWDAFTSLALDAAGNPVVSYYDYTNGDLKVLHCDDPNCAGDESGNITSPDTEGYVGSHSSLALDASGHPVISYYDSTNDDLKVLHCNDPNCAGGDESMTSAERADNVGQYTSLVLDASGNPVVSYRDPSDYNLNILHCNDPGCGASTDKDGDGCTAQQEFGSDPTQGGQRDPTSFWDYGDMPDPNANPQRDRMIRVEDILAVVARYGTDDADGAAEINRSTDPLSTPPKTGYHPAYDRGGQVGPNPWDQAPPNGQIRVADIMAVVYQYGHDCA